MLCDGKGEWLAARSWVPFIEGKKAYIAYAAWSQARLHGEKILLEAFSDTACTLRFQRHLWRELYASTGHLRTYISYEEYREIFETLWKDRALASGWHVDFLYEEYDTLLFFT